jgi:hypothetical protein
VTLERRPIRSSGDVDFPKEWGKPPADISKLEDWARRNILDGMEARARGEDVPWLEAERR